MTLQSAIISGMSAKFLPLSNPALQKSPSQDRVSESSIKDAVRTKNSAPLSTSSTNTEKDVGKISEIVDAVQESLEAIQNNNTQLQFVVHEKTHQVMVEVVNQESGEVVREIPSKEFLDLAAKFEKMVGLMFDMKI